MVCPVIYSLTKVTLSLHLKYRDTRAATNSPPSPGGKKNQNKSTATEIVVGGWLLPDLVSPLDGPGAQWASWGSLWGVPMSHVQYCHLMACSDP